MGKRKYGDANTNNIDLKLYVERAVEGIEGTKVFESEPEEFIVFDGFHSLFSIGGVSSVAANTTIYISGYCKGATRNAGGHGSIVGYQIGGFFGDRKSVV